MGNSQSNTSYQPNYKIYKITKIDSHDGATGFVLHDYITYKNGSYDFILFRSGRFHGCKVGDYLKVDLNKISDKTSGYFLINNEICGIVPIENSQVVEKRDSNGNITLEFFSEIGKNRERYQASVVDAQGSNYANFRQTSYDMPPK